MSHVNVTYEMIETEEYDAYGRAYVGYGIEAWSGSGTERICLHRVPDLFVSRARCERFVEMCNEESVAPFHLPEVIDNVLAEEWGV